MGAAAFAFQATNAVGGGFNQASSMRALADYKQKVNELNNKTIDYQIEQTEEQARDAVNRGGQAVNKRAQKTRLQVGAQRAAMAASGVDAPDVVNETLAIGAADEAALKANAWRDAFGFNAKGSQLRGEKVSNELETRTSSNALKFAAKSSMITGVTEGLSYGALAYGKASEKKPSGGKGKG